MRTALFILISLCFLSCEGKKMAYVASVDMQWCNRKYFEEEEVKRFIHQLVLVLEFETIGKTEFARFEKEIYALQTGDGVFASMMIDMKKNEVSVSVCATKPFDTDALKKQSVGFFEAEKWHLNVQKK